MGTSATFRSAGSCLASMAGAAHKSKCGRLKEYEDTGLTPEDCARAAEIDDILLDEYYSIGRMCELIKADKEGRVIVLPAVRYCEQYGWQNITWDEKYGVCAGSWNTCEEAEKALEAMKK